VAEEVAAALDATDKDVSIGGAGLAAAGIELGLVDEPRMFRYPVIIGGGTPFLPPVTEDVRLDLVETRTFGSRVIYERYGAPPAPPPGTTSRACCQASSAELLEPGRACRSAGDAAPAGHRTCDDFRSGTWRLNVIPDAQRRGVGRFAGESVAAEIRRRDDT